MSTSGSVILPERRPVATASSLWAPFCLCLLSLAAMGALFGGMQILIMGLAAGLAVLVWARPKEATSVAVLFLIACNILLPSTSRYEWTWRYYQPWEMRYWAAGLLTITLAAVSRIGIRVLWRIPASVKAFLAVAFVATLVGFARGNAPSFVIRQLYGSLLLVAYFAIAYHMGDEELFLRRLRTFGLLCAAGFFVYYAATFSELGFHKEITALGTLEGAAGILCFIKGLTEKRRGWMVSALVLLAVPFLLFERRMLVAIAVAAALAFAIKASSRKARCFYGGVAVLGILSGTLISGARLLLEGIESLPGIEEVLPSGGADVTSLTDRTIQLGMGVETLRRSPAFGEGFGAELTWEATNTHEIVQQAYIDNGWAYLAVKMGGLGILAFGWFLVATFRCMSRESLALSACLLSMVLVTMFSEPVFFNFNTSCLLGAMAGLLCARKGINASPRP
jgi:disulfide bond formation protein DsbB